MKVQAHFTYISITLTGKYLDSYKNPLLDPLPFFLREWTQAERCHVLWSMGCQVLETGLHLLGTKSPLGGFRHFGVAVSSQVISSHNGSWIYNQN